MTKLFFSLFLLITILTIPVTTVQAVLQSNKNMQYNKAATLPTWAKSIRKMEEKEGAMGLNETFNSNYTPIESNNIDVHMIKSTEYGAIAILSSSGYGHPKVNNENVNAITTTTGNNTGVFLDTTKREWVAGVYSSSVLGVEARYFNQYGSVKVGDALSVCAGWHSAGESKGVSGNTSEYIARSGLCRGYGGIFSYYGYNDTAYQDANGPAGNVGREWYARGVAVCGKGL